MCFQWDRKQRRGIAASTFETMKTDWIRGLRGQGIWTLLFFLDRGNPRFEGNRLFGRFRMDLESTMSRLLLIHSYYCRSVHRAVIYRRVIFITRDLLAARCVGILHIVNDDITRWLFEIYGRGYKGEELLSGMVHGSLHGPFSFVRGKWMMALKKKKKYTINFDTTTRRRLIPWTQQKGTLEWFRRATKISYVCDAFASSHYHRLSDAPFH